MSKRSRNDLRVSDVAKGAHRQVHQRAAGWTIYWYAWRGGPQIALFRGATRKDAEDAEEQGMLDMLEGYRRERSPRPADGTVARTAHAFLTSPEFNGLAPKTQQAWGPWIEHVREHWGHLSGEEFATDAIAAEVAAWRDEIALRSPSSADKAMEAVSRLCSYGRARGRPEGVRLPKDCNPVEGLGRTYVRPVQLPPGRTQVLDAIAALPPLASAICEIALNSGLRRSDLVLLSDTHIDEAAGIIRLGTKKGRRKRRVAVIRLTPPLLGAIQRAQAIRNETYARICERRRRKGRPEPAQPLTVLVNRSAAAFTADGLYQHVRAAFALAKRERINPHGFRRAAATQRFLSGLSWAQIGRELGWAEGEAETMGAIYVPDEALEDAG